MSRPLYPSITAAPSMASLTARLFTKAWMPVLFCLASLGRARRPDTVKPGRSRLKGTKGSESLAPRTAIARSSSVDPPGRLSTVLPLTVRENLMPG